MGDLLVNLLRVEECKEKKGTLNEKGILIRRGIAPEKRRVMRWVEEVFGETWATEVEIAYHNKPITCFVAIKDGEPIGFACYEATNKCFFGPTGVNKEHRGLGIGEVLLCDALIGLKELGYAYGIIGSAGPVGFYQKACQAMVIEYDTPNIYETMLE